MTEVEREAWLTFKVLLQSTWVTTKDPGYVTIVANMLEK
jgi:hypothetical protein